MPNSRSRQSPVIRRGFDLHPRPAWWREASRSAVLGPHWADLLARGGIPRTRLAVTGNPVCDEIHLVGTQRRGRWSDLYERLGLPAGTRYFLHCREHYARHGRVTNAEAERAQRAIIESFKDTSPETPIVVKMHPRDTAEDHAVVRAIDPSVIVVADVPLVELLAGSLVMVTTTSTTQLWSAALDRPTISAFFWKGHDYWGNVTAFSGVDRVFSPQQLRASLGRSLNDSAYQALWREKRRVFTREMLVTDGHSIERIVQLLQDPFS